MASGKMTMWNAGPNVMVDGKCEYANGVNGGMNSPAAQSSPYIKEQRYCAVNPTLFANGLACGRCYKISFDGKKGSDANCRRAGEAFIQVVDRSASSREFDCHLNVYNKITGCNTGEMFITYTPVECQGKGPPTVTVLDGGNAWSTKVIFSGLSRGVSAASMTLGAKKYPFKRTSGATWTAKLDGTRGSIPVSFQLTLENSQEVTLPNCFSKWTQATKASCSVGAVTGPTKKPVPSTTKNPSNPDTVRCGTSWADAASKCGKRCVKYDSECPGEKNKCWAGLKEDKCKQAATTTLKPTTKQTTATTGAQACTHTRTHHMYT